MVDSNAEYDLLLKGGHVIDPANGLDATSDVAIKDGKIARVDRDISPDAASKTVTLRDLYVMPGLIDLHMHSFGDRSLAIGADDYSLPNGITTAVDAGGSGYRTFEDWKARVIDTSKVRQLALLNIVRSGIARGAEQDWTEMQALPCAEMIQAYPDHIVGTKAAHYRGQGWDSVDGAVRAAEMSGTVAMIDYHNHPDRSYRELILDHMRPGDMHTHMYAQHLAQMDDNDRVYDYVFDARKRGVLFDLGHGSGSFWWRIARPAIEQGHAPDTVSTDVHQGSFYIPRATMPVCMSKLMNLGLSLHEVVEKSTAAPAQAIHRPDLGALSVGADADIAVFRLDEGDFGFVDSGIARMNGRYDLTCQMTIRAGDVLWDLRGRSIPDYAELGHYIRADQPDAPGLPREEVAT